MNLYRESASTCFESDKYVEFVVDCLHSRLFFCGQYSTWYVSCPTLLLLLLSDDRSSFSSIPLSVGSSHDNTTSELRMLIFGFKTWDGGSVVIQ